MVRLGSAVTCVPSDFDSKAGILIVWNKYLTDLTISYE